MVRKRVSRQRGRREVPAPYGQKMNEVTVRFWTDSIAKKPGHVIPKECWDGGIVALVRNPAHGIEHHRPVPFNSILELTSKLLNVLVASGIRLRPGKRTSQLLRPDRSRTR
jgi:hypothetical protein